MATTTVAQTETRKQATYTLFHDAVLPVKWFNDGRLYVKSASGGADHRIEFNAEAQQLTCTCADHYHRERACKHIRRAVVVLESANLSKLTVAQKHEWHNSYMDATRRASRSASVRILPNLTSLEQLY